MYNEQKGKTQQKGSFVAMNKAISKADENRW